MIYNEIPNLTLFLQYPLYMEIQYNGETLELKIKSKEYGKDNWSVSKQFKQHKEPLLASEEHLPKYHEDGVLTKVHDIKLEDEDSISKYDAESIKNLLSGVLVGINLVLFVKYSKFFSITEIIDFIIKFYKGVDNS